MSRSFYWLTFGFKLENGLIALLKIGVSVTAVISWPGQPALRLSDVYLTEAQVYLGGVYLTPAAHLPRLSKSQCVIGGNPPTQTEDQQLLMKVRSRERGVMGKMQGKWKIVNRKISQRQGHKEAMWGLNKKKIRSEETEIRLLKTYWRGVAGSSMK